MGLDNLKVAGYSGLLDILRVGVRKNDIQLHSIMSKVIRFLPKKDIDFVYQKWGSLTFEHKFDYSLLWKILGVVTILLGLLIVWNHKLMKLNRAIAGALILAESLRKKIARESCAESGRQTASFGVGCLWFGETKDSLIKRVDDALYVAKENGKKRVEAAR